MMCQLVLGLVVWLSMDARILVGHLPLPLRYVSINVPWSIYPHARTCLPTSTCSLSSCLSIYLGGTALRALVGRPSLSLPPSPPPPPVCVAIGGSALPAASASLTRGWLDRPWCSKFRTITSSDIRTVPAHTHTRTHTHTHTHGRRCVFLHVIRLDDCT